MTPRNGETEKRRNGGQLEPESWNLELQPKVGVIARSYKVVEERRGNLGRTWNLL